MNTKKSARLQIKENERENNVWKDLNIYPQIYSQELWGCNMEDVRFEEWGDEEESEENEW